MHIIRCGAFNRITVSLWKNFHGNLRFSTFHRSRIEVFFTQNVLALLQIEVVDRKISVVRNFLHHFVPSFPDFFIAVAAVVSSMKPNRDECISTFSLFYVYTLE